MDRNGAQWGGTEQDRVEQKGGLGHCEFKRQELEAGVDVTKNLSRNNYRFKLDCH